MIPQSTPQTMRTLFMLNQKILLYDIETFAHWGRVWGKWQQDVIKFAKYGSIACIAYRWLGQKKISTLSRRNYPSDKALLIAFQSIIGSADKTIAHNGDRFDKPSLNAFYAKNRLTPHKPTIDIDTLKIAKKYFRFPSNSLDDLADYLGVKKKVKHPGFDMWEGCEKGIKKYWELMERYNRGDIITLEAVYHILKPWIYRQPSISLSVGGISCDACGSPNITKRGCRIVRSGKKRQQYQCQDCGAWKTE